MYVDILHETDEQHQQQHQSGTGTDTGKTSSLPPSSTSYNFFKIFTNEYYPTNTQDYKKTMKGRPRSNKKLNRSNTPPTSQSTPPVPTSLPTAPQLTTTTVTSSTYTISTIPSEEDDLLDVEV